MPTSVLSNTTNSSNPKSTPSCHISSSSNSPMNNSTSSATSPTLF